MAYRMQKEDLGAVGTFTLRITGVQESEVNEILRTMNGHLDSSYAVATGKFVRKVTDIIYTDEEYKW